MQQDAIRTLAARLLDLHGLTEKGWTFDLEAHDSRRGVCLYTTRQIRMSSLMTPYMTEDDVEQTLLHEIGHALTPSWRPDGTRVLSHGPEWKRTAASIGYRGAANSPDPRIMHRLAGLAIDAPLEIGATVANADRDGVVVKLTPTRVSFAKGHTVATTLRTAVVVTAAATDESRVQATLFAEANGLTKRANLLRKGTQVIVLGGGKYGGQRATIHHVTKHRYHLTLDNSATAISAPFTLVQAA